MPIASILSDEACRLHAVQYRVETDWAPQLRPLRASVRRTPQSRRNFTTVLMKGSHPCRRGGCLLSGPCWRIIHGSKNRDVECGIVAVRHRCGAHYRDPARRSSDCCSGLRREVPDSVTEKLIRSLVMSAPRLGATIPNISIAATADGGSCSQTLTTGQAAEGSAHHSQLHRRRTRSDIGAVSRRRTLKETNDFREEKISTRLHGGIARRPQVHIFRRQSPSRAGRSKIRSTL
jgi:hypothetical protein